MTQRQLDRMLRACRRVQPFRRYEIVFVHGQREIVPHPEFIEKQGDTYIFHEAEGGRFAFVAESVAGIRLTPPKA